jgi:hypothetical protein
MLDRTAYTPAPVVPSIATPTFSPAVSNLVDAFHRATPAERLAAARAIGVGRLWDEMIVPAID